MADLRHGPGQYEERFALAWKLQTAEGTREKLPIVMI